MIARLLRTFRFAADTAVYGPAYAAIHNLINVPRPLEPERLWEIINPANPQAGRWLAEHYPPAFIRRSLIAGKMRQDHAQGISKHYDVSNEFYELFLDRNFMFYSCADFSGPDDTLEQAQTNKANFILNLIDPQPDDKILDLGCGWGAMLNHICQHTGDKQNLYGYTLSQEQVNYNREHHQFQVELKNFITCEYPPNHFDKIYSIGSWEHVRHADLAEVLGKLHQALKPGGRMVKHFICPQNGRLSTDVIVAQLFFPGSWIPGYATQVEAFETAGFRIVQQTEHDYRPTLRAWFDNLVANHKRAIELVGLKTYNKYLVFFAASHSYFQRKQAVLRRFVLEKESVAA